MALPGADYAAYFGGRIAPEFKGKGLAQQGELSSIAFLRSRQSGAVTMAASRMGVPASAGVEETRGGRHGKCTLWWTCGQATSTQDLGKSRNYRYLIIIQNHYGWHQ